MENTVTISVSEYNRLRDGFENSKFKVRLEKEVEHLKKELDKKDEFISKISETEFFTLEVQDGLWTGEAYKFYEIRKNKTPKWITRLFN